MHCQELYHVYDVWDVGDGLTNSVNGFWGGRFPNNSARDERASAKATMASTTPIAIEAIPSQ